jgi:hypothetical protein
MSQGSLLLSERARPRWSMPLRPLGAALAQIPLSPAPIAGLPLSSATVWVGPPFDRRPRESNSGLTSSKLWPLSVMVAPAL